MRNDTLPSVEAVREFAMANTPLTTGDVMKEFDCNRSTAARRLKVLVDGGELVTRGKGAGTKYGRRPGRPKGSSNGSGNGSGHQEAAVAAGKAIANEGGDFLTVLRRDCERELRRASDELEAIERERKLRHAEIDAELDKRAVPVRERLVEVGLVSDTLREPARA